MTQKKPLRILFVTAHCPHGPVYGAQLRTLHIARILKRCGEVDMLIFPFALLADEDLRRTNDEFQVRGVFYLNQRTNGSLGARLKREFDPYSADTESKRLSAGDQEKAMSLMDDYDLVWFYGISIPNCLGRKRWHNAILDIDDVPSQCFEGKAREAKDVRGRLLAKRKVVQWKRREKVVLKRFNVIGVSSEADWHYFGGGDRVRVIPNGFEAPTRLVEKNPANPVRIGFIGTLNYAPNLEGIRWFVDEVWPLVRARIPSARLRLVGAGTDSFNAGEDSNIDGLGFVDDSVAEISTWALTIVPIFVGGGTRIKIAEAFCRHCPVVSTTQGAYGYSVTSGDECFLADTAGEFANACLSLLEDPDVGAAMTARARAKFDREFDWDAIAPRVIAAVNACLEFRPRIRVEA